ncbi:MAG TPA: Gfo/Idh/MocA family oxidoreductase [Thermoanaerobaculia bacterium]|jgi:predicted dehydrogenase|nr:Gfo/Idh/MocA family oxidoreductase [Thermoanaerobaculia bacterium]
MSEAGTRDEGRGGGDEANETHETPAVPRPSSFVPVVGVVGTGYLGRLHARILTEMPEATVAGFVEPDDAIAADIIATLKLKRFDSVASLAREIDCAVVATPTTTHFDVARELLEAGCDVMVEKPITPTVDEARRLIDIANSRNRILQVGHVERYNPAITAVAPILKNVLYVEAERLGVFVGRSLDIDVLLDLMIHDLNLVLSFLGQRVVDVRAVGVAVMTEKVDITNVRIEFENGAVANLTASRVSQDRVRKTRFFSREAYISVDTKEQEVKGYRLAGKTVLPIEVVVTKQEPLRAELEAFIECVRTRSRPLVSGEDGLAAVELAIRVAQAIDESLKRFESLHPS